MNRSWICADVWMDTFPFFDHAQLGLKMALLSPRFDVLVDKHFDGQSELTIWRPITICKQAFAEVPKLYVNNTNSVPFPLPDHSLHNKIRIKRLHIIYIDHSVIAFLRSNQQIWDKGTDLRLYFLYSHDTEEQMIWDDFLRQIWPIFASNIRHLGFPGGAQLNNLRRITSPAIITELNINSIICMRLFLDAIADDGPNATAGQALSKWLHTPRKDGQPKRLFCHDYSENANIEWVNNFKEKFPHATTSASYKIQFTVHATITSMVPFELTNERTKEKLTLTKASENNSQNRWIIKRCQIGETAAVHWEEENWDDVNTVHFVLFSTECIGPLSTPPAEEEAGQSSQKGAASSDNE